MRAVFWQPSPPSYPQSTNRTTNSSLPYGSELLFEISRWLGFHTMYFCILRQCCPENRSGWLTGYGPNCRKTLGLPVIPPVINVERATDNRRVFRTISLRGEQSHANRYREVV
jgi:hypothetical protein